jgi:hemerythrin-like domain-containing protein
MPSLQVQAATPPPPTTGRVAAQALRRDHQRLDELLIQARLRVAYADLFDAGPVFDDFRHGLDRHIEGEEQYLFPAMEPIAADALSTLREEHAALRTLMRECSEALADTDPVTFQQAAAELEDLLGAHDTRERRDLYALADARLDEHGLAELLKWLNMDANQSGGGL